MYFIKSVSIQGMHNVSKKTIEFNEAPVYIQGRNGSGKSTILQAIQLALLGYVPGRGKTNAAIFQHANNDVGMSVQVVLSNESNETVTIKRVFQKVKSSVTSELVTDPDDFDLEQLFKDLELPLFNFNEFLNMSANAQKSWFLQFLPSANLDSGLRDKFVTDANEYRNTNAHIDEVLNTLFAKVAEIEASDSDAITQVSEVNNYLKSVMSSEKAAQKAYASTAQSLVYYDDVGADESSLVDIDQKISELRRRRDARIRYQTAISSYNASTALIESMRSQLISEEELQEMKTRHNELAKLEKNVRDEMDEHRELVHRTKLEIMELDALIGDGRGICPYSSEVCPSISEKIDFYKSEKQRLQDLYANYSASYEESSKQSCAMNNERANLYAAIERQTSLREQIATIEQTAFAPEETETASVSLIDSLIQEAETLKEQTIANVQYTRLMGTVTRDKAAVEILIDLLKGWIDYTGPNGIQSQIAEKPFEDLESQVNDITEKMFGLGYQAKFLVSNKANSFSFGLLIDGEYIPFMLLSSGEKCMFTIALMTALVNASAAPIKVVMIDDMFDNLDPANLENTLRCIQSIRGVQYILAGVANNMVDGYNIINMYINM